jgi:hypothetical protein
MPARRPAKDFAVAAFVIAISNPYRRLLEQRCQGRLELYQRQPRNVLAV